MKTIFVFWCALFYLFQIGVSTDPLVPEVLANAVNKCVNQLNLDKETMVKILNQSVLPEDDPKFTEFFECYARSSGVLKDDSTIDEEKFKDILTQIMKPRLGDIPDVEAKASGIAAKAVDQCKDTPKGENDGISAIKVGNCIRALGKKGKQ